ncbi:MAG: diaminopimelate decarboxylase [Clostridia bacterium]|nr:diaminopimelate decarboxylase [Clostridia bacterium]
MIHSNFNINEINHLTFAGADCVGLAKKYGTPLYVIDEDMIRENCRIYRYCTEKYFGSDSLPLYASKALCCKEIYRILAEEGIGADVVSAGEIFTAMSVGFPADRIYFHGNNKTAKEIEYAFDCGIGAFIIDNTDELFAVNEEALKRNKVQNVMLRLSPGIDPHTFKAVMTGSVDSKFGVPIETGQAFDFVKSALGCKGINVEGIHCHIGSQIFDVDPFVDAARIMLDFTVEIRNKLGYTFKKINLGGGIGVRYVESDPKINIGDVMFGIGCALQGLVESRGLKPPVFMFEMGRFIVANAGATLYTVGSVKQIKGYKNYVCIDGGMTDNPRFALYGAKHTVYNASDASCTKRIKADLAGRNCESDDLIGEDMDLPEFKKDDILAVAVTGAYNYTMASNYNRVPRPAMVSVSKGTEKLIVKRETFEDMIKNEV